MEVVKISELKNRLSHYLRQVRRGKCVLIADRDRVIARIDPVASGAPENDDEGMWLDELERRGTIRRAREALDASWIRERPRVSQDVVAALIEERGEGR